MTIQITASVIGGVFNPDESLHLAEQIFVRLTEEAFSSASPKTTAQEAWESILAQLKERPIHGSEVRYTRDELHKRR